MAEPLRKRLPRSQRRAQLLEVARQVFAKRGLDGASIEEIAERAGISRPIVYDHFGDKSGLYQTVVDAEVDALVERLSRAMAAPSGRERLERAFLEFLTYAYQCPDGYSVLLEAQRIGAPGRLSGLIHEVGVRATEVLERDLAHLSSSQDAAPVYAHALIGMATLVGLWWRQTDHLPLEEVARHLASLAWNGLRNLPARPQLQVVPPHPQEP